MAYVNKGMTDSGGGTKFNYSAPRTVVRTTTPVPTAKANRDTQTRFEKEEQARLAAQAKMIAEQKAIADATAKFQFMEAQRLAAAEAERQRQAAAIAEQKRLKIERDNWEASLDDYAMNTNGLPKPGKGPGMASTLPPAKPNNSFWNQATSGVENFFQGLGKQPNAIPSQARDALAMATNGKAQTYWKDATGKVEDYFERAGKLPNAIPTQARDALNMREQRNSIPETLVNFYNTNKPGFESAFRTMGKMPNAIPTQARDALKTAEDRFTRMPNEGTPFTGRGTTVNQGWKPEQNLQAIQDKVANIINSASDWSANKINRAEDQAANAINSASDWSANVINKAQDTSADILNGELTYADVKKSLKNWADNFKGPNFQDAQDWAADIINRISGLPLAAATAIGNAVMSGTNALLDQQGAAALSQFGVTLPPNVMAQREPISFASYAKDMQTKGPFMPGQNVNGPLQDRFTGEDKLSYQSRLPSYWENAGPEQFNFYRYQKASQAADEAEAAYQGFAQPFKDFKTWEDANPPAELYSWVTAEDRANQEKIKNRPTFDPTTGFGQRLLLEQSGEKQPTYAETWQDMRTDINAKTRAADNLTAGYKAMLETKTHAPTQYILDNLDKFRVNTIEDYYKYVWNQSDPDTKLSPNTRMVAGVDPNTGQMMVLPMEYFLGDRSMWDQGLMDKAFGGGHTVMNGNMFGGEDTALTNPRRPLKSDAADPFLDYYVNPKIDRGWAINETEALPEAAAAGAGDGGYGYGDGGGYSYGSGGSYWSPSGYYDNQYTKERYGYFQNLAKWVI